MTEEQQFQQHALYLCNIWQQMKDETIRRLPENIKRSYLLPAGDEDKISIVFSHDTYFVSPEMWEALIFGYPKEFGIMVIDEFNGVTPLNEVLFDKYVRPTKEWQDWTNSWHT